VNPYSIPPLIRGVGLTIVLAGTLVGLIQARSEVEPHTRLTPSTSAVPSKPVTELGTLSAEIHELREELQEESFAEVVFENRWFEWLGIIGSGIMTMSFYAEWFIRRKEKA
jgi:hypothetical protein